jgi:hypothetical protein
LGKYSSSEVNSYIYFHKISGLKVNFHKILLVGINVAGSWLGDAANVLNCKVGQIPFIYLGLSIGGNAKRLSFWVPLIGKIKNKLSGFNQICFVLNSSLRSLSFFKASTNLRSVFYLCLDKDVSVAYMRRLGGGNGWRWRKRLFAWQEKVWGHCCSPLVIPGSNIG